MSVDLELEAGTYSVLMKITAERWSIKPTPEQVIRDSCRGRQQKLIQIGLAYDLAHAKGQIKESDVEKQLRKEREEKKKVVAKKQRREELREQKFKEWQIDTKQKARDKRHAKRKEERHRKRAESAKPAALIEDSVSGEALPPDSEAAVDTPAAVSGSNTEQEPASGNDVETEAPESKSDAAALPSPPPDTQPAEPETTDCAPTEEASAGEPSQTSPTAVQRTPLVLVNGTSSAPATPSIAGPPPLDSDYESDTSFNSSIDSDLDFPSSLVVATVDVPAAMDDDVGDDDEDLDFENDPWNAVCVVGLRVYSKDPETCIDVVRPKEEDDSETPLDVDDISKGASGEKVEDQVV